MPLVGRAQARCSERFQQQVIGRLGTIPDMTGRAPTLPRIAVVGLVLALALCLVLPMDGENTGMSFTLACCFVLSVFLGVFLLGRSGEGFVFATRPRPTWPLARGPTPAMQRPDIIALGSLRI